MDASIEINTSIHQPEKKNVHSLVNSPSLPNDLKLPRITRDEGNGEKAPVMKLNLARLTLSSKQLTKRQKQAFFHAFLLFDRKRNGCISYNDIIETLRHVKMPVNDKAMHESILAQDETLSKVMNFEGYLNFMTNEDVFLSLVGVNLPRSSRLTGKNFLMYQVLYKFIEESVLEEAHRKEVVKYYSGKLEKLTKKKYSLTSAAHVVHHYADGARSLGLSDKEVFKQIEMVKQQHKGDVREKSPYARPIHLTLAETKTNKAYQHKMRRSGWNTRQSFQYGVNLPAVIVSADKTFRDSQSIRQKIDLEKQTYYRKLSLAQKKNFQGLWKNLRVEDIPTSRLQANMKAIYDTYTSISKFPCRKGRPLRINPLVYWSANDPHQHRPATISNLQISSS